MTLRRGGGTSQAEWWIVSFGDFSRNPGKTDTLIRHNNTGQLEPYNVSGNAITTVAAMG